MHTAVGGRGGGTFDQQRAPTAKGRWEGEDGTHKTEQIRRDGATHEVEGGGASEKQMQVIVANIVNFPQGG